MNSTSSNPLSLAEKRMQIINRIEESKENLAQDFNNLKDDLNPLNIVKDKVSDLFSSLQMQNEPQPLHFLSSAGKVIKEDRDWKKKALYIGGAIGGIALVTWVKHGKVSPRLMAKEVISHVPVIRQFI